MTQDAIRRALARMGEAQNELHDAMRAAHGADIGQHGQSVPDAAGFESQTVHQSVRVGTTGHGDVPRGRVTSSHTNGDEAVLRETAPASLIERAKAYSYWSFSQHGDAPEDPEAIIRDLAAAQPEEPETPSETPGDEVLRDWLDLYTGPRWMGDCDTAVIAELVRRALEKP